MAVADPVNGLRTFLLADSDLSALVGTAVFAGELPDADWLLAQHSLTMPGKAVVITPSGGLPLGPAARSFIPWLDFRVDVKAYGRTPTEAREVYWATHAALHQMQVGVRTNSRLFSATVSGGPQQLRDQDSDWPYVLASFDIHAGEFSV